MSKKPLLIVATALLLASCGGTSSSNTGGGGGSLADTYRVTFHFTDDISRPYIKEVEKGQSLSSSPTPTREGYDFAGWYTAEDGGEAVNFPYTANGDVSLYAHWDAATYDVTFDLNYEGAPEASVVKIAYGQSIEPIEAPTRDKFVFRYWTMDKDGLQQAEFPYLVKKDTTFFASWRDADTKIFTVTVHYGDYEGAPENKTIELEEGQSLTRTLLPDPEGPAGYSFEGWSLTDGGEAITLPYTPTDDIDVYALWSRVEYKADFYYNYVDSPSTYYLRTTYFGGDEVVAPEDDPTRPGYVFDGWYTANIGGNKVTFPVKGQRNLKYYAHWISNPVTTDIFHAEYTEFDPNFDYPGYSGAAKGTGCIIKTTAPNALVDNYPTNSMRAAGNAFVVSYQYSNNAVLTFNVEASEDINGAKLFVNWSTEFDQVFGPSGLGKYDIKVNGVAVSYPETALYCDPVNFASPGPFVLTELGTVNLVKGNNVITMSPDNNIVNGAMTAMGPVVDYIKFDYSGNDKLSWKPVYDNIDGKAS